MSCIHGEVRGTNNTVLLLISPEDALQLTDVSAFTSKDRGLSIYKAPGPQRRISGNYSSTHKLPDKHIDDQCPV